MEMKVTPLGIEGAWLLESPIHPDDRGVFREWFNSDGLKDSELPIFEVRQANTSMSAKGVIRGIHFSSEQNGQAKLVTCTFGSVLDVVVDLRPDSHTFGSHIRIKLSAVEGKSLFISKGLGHAFQSLEDNSTVTYLLDKEYNPDEEFGITPLDLSLDIPWNKSGLNISKKDAEAPTTNVFFEIEKSK
jgi:dTDP-4-dehydrorhamnose 3,5-epimerase